MGKCAKCAVKADEIEDNMLYMFENQDVETVTYKSWTSTDRSTLETLTKPVDEFTQEFMKNMKKLREHDYVICVVNNGP